MKVDFKHSAIGVAKKIANATREIGEGAIRCTKSAAQKTDEFVKSKKLLKNIKKEHVVGASVLLVATSLAVGCVKGLKSSIDEEIKK